MWKLGAHGQSLRPNLPWGVAGQREARSAAPLGLEGVDGARVVRPPAGVGDVVFAAAEAPAGPPVDEGEGRRLVARDVRLEAARKTIEELESRTEERLAN